MIKDISGQYVPENQGLDHWSALFEEWRLLVEKVCRISPADAPYLYREMTNVSVLAGAAWRAGYIALSEVKAERNADKDARWGRADLYIENDLLIEFIEAKYAFSHGYQKKNISGKIEELVDKSLSDVKTLSLENDREASGVAFVAPYWKIDDKKYKYLKSPQKQINELVDHVGSEFDGALAWTFPSVRRELKGKVNFYPGVFLAVKKFTR